jgi:hypothetical protein
MQVTLGLTVVLVMLVVYVSAAADADACSGRHGALVAGGNVRGHVVRRLLGNNLTLMAPAVSVGFVMTTPSS